MKLRYIALASLAVIAVASCARPANTATAVPQAAPSVAAATASAAASPVATPSPQPTPTVAPSTVYVQPAPTPTVYVQPAPPTYYVVPPQAAQGPMDGPNVYPINSEGSLVNVRINPSTVSAVVGMLAQDQYVHIACTQYGDAVTGPWGTTALWDFIDSPYHGYVSDMWVNTATGRPVVGSC